MRNKKEVMGSGNPFGGFLLFKVPNTVLFSSTHPPAVLAT